MIPPLYLPLRGEGEGVDYVNLLIAFVLIRKPKNIKPIYDLNHRGQCKFPFITGRIDMLTSPFTPCETNREISCVLNANGDIFFTVWVPF
jgi:hypothetical protein